MPTTSLEKRRGPGARMMDGLERVGNLLPSPAAIFLILLAIVAVLSAIFAATGASVTYMAVDNATKEVVETTVVARSLLSADGIRHMITNVISNFTGFTAMGMVFTVMIFVAIAEGTGFMGAIIRRVVAKTPKALITSVVILLGMLCHVASSAAYVILVPLAASIFISFKRHPIAGIAAAFAGASGGYSANIIIGTADPMFASISTTAANILDPNYTVNPLANWYFMIASTVVIVIVGTIVTHKFVEPRLAKYEYEVIEEEQIVSSAEKRGLRFAGIAFLIYLALVLLAILPENAVLNPDGNLVTSPFMKGLLPILGGMFLVLGVSFGIGARTLSSDKQVVEHMKKGVNGISSFMVMVFFAAQFVNNFSYSNLGTLLSVNGARWLEKIGFVGLPLIIVFVIFSGCINFFIPMDSAKWLMLAPIFVPMLMQLGISPEATQAAYRIGDSVTNIITPVMGFYPLILALCQKHTKKFGAGSLMTTMLPYTGFFLVSWLALYAVFFLLKLPLGPGSVVPYIPA